MCLPKSIPISRQQIPNKSKTLIIKCLEQRQEFLAIYISVLVLIWIL
jgi:hypothetical protein